MGNYLQSARKRHKIINIFPLPKCIEQKENVPKNRSAGETRLEERSDFQFSLSRSCVWTPVLDVFRKTGGQFSNQKVIRKKDRKVSAKQRKVAAIVKWKAKLENFSQHFAKIYAISCGVRKFDFNFFPCFANKTRRKGEIIFLFCEWEWRREWKRHKKGKMKRRTGKIHNFVLLWFFSSFCIFVGEAQSRHEILIYRSSTLETTNIVERCSGSGGGRGDRVREVSAGKL